MMRIVMPNRLSGPFAAAVAGTLLALAAGAVTVRTGAVVPIAGVLAIALVLYVATRPINGLFAGVTLILLVPYWYSKGGITVTQMTAALALGGAMVAVLVERRTLRFTVVDYAVLGVLLAAVVDWYLREGNFAGARATANTVTPFAFYFAARLLTGPGRSARRLLWLVTAAGALASLTLMYEYAKGTALFINASTYLWNSGSGSIFRPGGVYGSPPAAVTVLAMVALVGIPLLSETTGRRRAGLFVCLALVIGGGFLTFTRAGWIGCGAGLLVYVCILKWRGGVQLPRWLPAVPVIGLLFLAALPALSQTSWFRFGVSRGQTFQFRKTYWSVSEQMITDSPVHLLFGRGLTSLTAAVEPALGGVQASLAEIPGPLTRTTHNQYLQTLLEQGVVGLTLYLLWLVGTLALGLRRLRRLPVTESRIVAGLLGATISFVIASYADSSFREDNALVVVAVLTGLTVSMCSPARRAR